MEICTVTSDFHYFSFNESIQAESEGDTDKARRIQRLPSYQRNESQRELGKLFFGKYRVDVERELRHLTGTLTDYLNPDKSG
jgi:hypothetical protein